ncbi:MAG: hypothetical protein Q4D56_08095 [Bacteroides sp.]|nr:hypothetical protein [Bacteroides sp.]
MGSRTTSPETLIPPASQEKTRQVMNRRKLPLLEAYRLSAAF